MTFARCAGTCRSARPGAVAGRPGREDPKPTPSETLSVTSLVTSGIEGKNAAMADYGEMLWKIRGGYAAVLYGTFTLVVALSDKAKVGLSGNKAAAIALILITGFTVCAAALDFHFLRSKLRVVDTKEELVDLALHLASGATLEEWRGRPLALLLHNAGEHRLPLRPSDYPSPWPVWLLHAGTWAPLSLATLLMVA